MTQFGERWYTLRDEVDGRISGMICAAVAPLWLLASKVDENTEQFSTYRSQ